MPVASKPPSTHSICDQDDLLTQSVQTLPPSLPASSGNATVRRLSRPEPPSQLIHEFLLRFNATPP
jgi:hypothetical protein